MIFRHWIAPAYCGEGGRMNDRRTFLALAGGGAAALLLFGRTGNAAVSFEINRSPADWQRRLGPARFHILREAGTERAFTSPLLNEHRRGTFVCAACALPLFSSATKYDSGT